MRAPLLLLALALGGCFTAAGLRGNQADEIRVYAGDVDVLAKRLLSRPNAGTDSQIYVATERTIPGELTELAIDQSFLGMAQNQIVATLELHRADPGRVRFELRAVHGLLGTTVDEAALWSSVEACTGSAPVR